MEKRIIEILNYHSRIIVGAFKNHKAVTEPDFANIAHSILKVLQAKKEVREFIMPFSDEDIKRKRKARKQPCIVCKSDGVTGFCKDCGFDVDSDDYTPYKEQQEERCQKPNCNRLKMVNFPLCSFHYDIAHCI